MTTQELSSRARIRQWVREEIEGKEEVSLPVLANEAVNAFRKDTKFLRQLAEESLRDMVYELARQTVERTRGLWMANDDTALSQSAVRRRAGTHSIFRDWLEHAGDKHVRLMDMSREDLLIAAAEREKRGRHEIGLAALWRTLADRLEGGETVGNRFTASDVEAMYEGIDHA